LAARAGSGPAAPEAGRNGSFGPRPELLGVALGGLRYAIAPDPQVPHWREADGTRQSYQTLRCGLEPGSARALGEAHVAAIQAIAAAALAAAEGGDRRETRRLAAAARRLCGEIAGLWPPTALEVPKR
jgi:hypothetical protein